MKDVLDLVAAGASREEILADYPYPEDEDIHGGSRVRRTPGRSSDSAQRLMRFLVDAQLPRRWRQDVREVAAGWSLILPTELVEGFEGGGSDA